MGKTGVRTHKKMSAKSAVKPATKRKQSASAKKAVAAKSDKAFMLKEKARDGEKLIVKDHCDLPKARRKATARKSKTAEKSAAKAVQRDQIQVEIRAGEAPLPRAQAPVVWQKAGPLDNFRYWLRAWGRSMTGRLRNGRKVLPPTQAPIGAKLRSKNDLLREIAVLRQENAIMRSRLGLPHAAFGRQVADAI